MFYQSERCNVRNGVVEYVFDPQRVRRRGFDDQSAPLFFMCTVFFIFLLSKAPPCVVSQPSAFRMRYITNIFCCTMNSYIHLACIKGMEGRRGVRSTRVCKGSVSRRSL